MKNKSIRLLWISMSDPESPDAPVAFLRQHGFDIKVQVVSTASLFQDALEKPSWDLILSDAACSAPSSESVLSALGEKHLDIPCIVIGVTQGEDQLATYMAAGARDALERGHLSRLIPIIDRELQESMIRSQLKQAAETTRHLAYHDSLTGLPNRTLFANTVQDALAQARREGRVAALFFLNLDRFKMINDTFGHGIADLLLQGVAERLLQIQGEREAICRSGGDEFLLLKQVDRLDEAMKTGLHIVELLRQPFVIDGHEILLTTSVGVSLFPDHGEDYNTLMRNAMLALVRTKANGRNHFLVYSSEMHTDALKRLTLENSLRRALDQKEFIVFYQPQVDLKTGHIIGMEALVRWQIQGFGLVAPNEFIPVAEETGLIIPIGEWVLRNSCEQTCAWQKAGLPPMEVAVNLSARQFQQQDLVARIDQILKQTGLEPRRLELEITESSAMQDADYTIAVLRELKAMGVRISLDDFGTGYSSLSYLKLFPIDTLKIDRSFIRDLTTDPNDAAISKAIVLLAHSLNLQVVAEGVETLEQLTILKEQGCDKMQGFLFSRPVATDAFEKLLRDKKHL